MEFEEMRKIWDAQNNEPIYAINEQALHNRIKTKQKQANRITHVSEVLSIAVYTFTAIFLVVMNFVNNRTNVFLLVLGAWMLASATYILVSRVRRIKGERKFDRSISGDLKHAISVASYQVNLSYLMRWNTLPIGLLTLLGVWDGSKSIWLPVGVGVFFLIGNYVGRWEHHHYKSRKRELELLQNKLEQQ